MSEVTYGLAEYVKDLRRIRSETADPAQIVAKVSPHARELARTRTWLEPRHYQCDEEQGFGVHLLYEEPDHTLAVFALAWLPQRGAPPHNHGTWAVVAGVDGPETNVFWRRLDDASRPGYAEIRRQGTRTFGPGDVLTLLPDAIHSVHNETGRVTVSLHTYGKHLNHTGRSRFDPERNLEEPFIVTQEG